jgi:hypothetical protein
MKCGNPERRHCERSEAIQQDKNAFFKTIWIATSALCHATPAADALCNDEAFWVAASATPLPRFARNSSLVAMTEIQNAVIANEVKQSSKTKDAFCLKHLDCHVGCAVSQ